MHIMCTKLDGKLSLPRIDALTSMTDTASVTLTSTSLGSNGRTRTTAEMRDAMLPFPNWTVDRQPAANHICSDRLLKSTCNASDHSP